MDRTEIECANCGGHLGHEFLGEHLTDKNIRECVNSLSIRFIPKGKELSRTVLPGYSGGTIENPSYDKVCGGNTGHAESIQIVFDPKVITFKKLLEIFWHTHDPTTLNRQGNDVGTQYRSAIFFIINHKKKLLRN